MLPRFVLVGSVSPYQVNVAAAGVSGNYDVLSTYQNCYGSQYTLPTWASWNVAQPGVASVYTPTYGHGTVNGSIERYTGVTAYWGVEAWHPYVEDCLVDSWTDEEPAATQVICATVTNFRQTAGYAAPNGELRFEYRWDSASGNPQDLSRCDVGEKVDYTPWPWPSPPFVDPPPTNPYIKNVPATDGVFTDVHSTSYISPYSAIQTNGAQIYRHSCSCFGGPQWTTVLTPFAGIVRKFESNGNGTWRLTASTSGVVSTVNPLPQ